MEFAMKLLNIATVAFCLFASAAAAATPEGNWVSEDGATKVHISTCRGNSCVPLLYGSIIRSIPRRESRRPTSSIRIRRNVCAR